MVHNSRFAQTLRKRLRTESNDSLSRMCVIPVFTGTEEPKRCVLLVEFFVIFIDERITFVTKMMRIKTKLYIPNVTKKYEEKRRYINLVFGC